MSSGSEGGAKLLEMRDYVASQFRSYGAVVRSTVDDRIRQITHKLDGNVMDSTNAIGEKIDDIYSATSGTCYYDDRDNTASLYISRRNFKFMKKLQQEQPKAFEDLAAYAEKFTKLDDSVNRSEEVSRHFRENYFRGFRGEGSIPPLRYIRGMTRRVT
jgi:hypothetical protein